MTSSEPLDGERDRLIWAWALKQEQYVYTEFGVAILGIGALYFAYGQVTTGGVKAIIAAVGLLGSIVLFGHIWGSGRQYYAAMKILAKTNPRFVEEINGFSGWWKRGRIARYLYQPPRRLMLVLMGFVGYSWFILLSYRVYSLYKFGLDNAVKSPELRPGFDALFWSILIVIVFGIGIVVSKKYRDLQRP